MVDFSKNEYNKIEEDKKEMDHPGLTVEDYPGGYYDKDLGEFVTMKADSFVTVTIYDLSQEYSKSEDRKHTFKSYEEFEKVYKKDKKEFDYRPFIITFEKGKIVKIEEKFLN